MKLTKKQAQEIENWTVKSEYKKFAQIWVEETGTIKALGRLRSCSAYVFESDSYIVLQTYNRIIAFYDKHTETLVDVLRLVYGYTSIAAQRIAKFSLDFCGEKTRLTYRV